MNQNPISADTEPRPVSPYGIAKFTGGIHIPDEPEFSVFTINEWINGNKFNQLSDLKTEH